MSIDLPADFAAYRILQSEKWNHSDLLVAQGLASTGQALRLALGIAADIGSDKLADIARSVEEIELQRAREGIRCRRRVTDRQRHALASALLERFGEPRSIVKAGWGLTDEQIDELGA